MRAALHAHLINDRFGDPGLFVDFFHERRAILVDLGDLRALSPRKLLRVSHLFVTHTHIDHFAGFDRFLRICLGRGRRVGVYGPRGFLDRLERKLGAYTWNLVGNYPDDLIFEAGEVLHGGGDWRQGAGVPLTLEKAVFRLHNRFRREAVPVREANDGVLVDEDNLEVRTCLLDHQIPSLGFALREKRHIGVLKTELYRLGLDLGDWLAEVRRAIHRDDPDETPIEARLRDRRNRERKAVPLGLLRERCIRIVPGQKIVYVADALYSEANAERIVALARDAEVLFIEAAFVQDEADIAAHRYHLTARQAGTLARRAGVKRLVPFHFSPRYADRPELLEREAQTAFRGGDG